MGLSRETVNSLKHQQFVQKKIFYKYSEMPTISKFNVLPKFFERTYTKFILNVKLGFNLLQCILHPKNCLGSE